MNLDNKVAIITGASKGIGKAVAKELAKNGTKCAISARSKELLEKCAEELRDMGVQVFTYYGDMSVEDDIIKFVNATAKEFGRINILINNAGLGYFSPISELSTSKWDEMFNLNVRGLFIATRECLPYLRKFGESIIVNIASLAGKNAYIGGGGYAASKHAVLGFSRCLMLEERKNGVRVLAICPGSVATNFFDNHPERIEDKVERILSPEEIASTIVHMIQLPQKAMISEVDIRPTNP